jgi:hypothetical protein
MNCWKGLESNSLMDASMTMRENVWTCLSHLVWLLFSGADNGAAVGLRGGPSFFFLFFWGLQVLGSIVSPSPLLLVPCIMLVRREFMA